MKIIILLLVASLMFAEDRSNLNALHTATLEAEVIRLNAISNMYKAQVEAILAEQKANEAKAAEQKAMEESKKEEKK